MIVLFHSFCLFTRYVCSFLSNLDVSQSKKLRVYDPDFPDRKKYQVHSVTDLDEDLGIRFFPQLYVQRYSTVRRVLEDEKWKGNIRKIVDFGCAEFGFFQYVKKLEGVHEILEVDVNKSLLENHYCKVTPLNSDYLNQRCEPLTVYVLHGSIAHQDKCLIGCDAVVCIELIEHLFPEVLEDLPFTVFGFIKPRVAIFTTPNVEFNVHFSNFTGFRHPDHKFEWTRSQFECWGKNIVTRYPEYKVSFHDIGLGLEGKEHLGGCSQMAVFEKSSPSITSAQSLDTFKDEHFVEPYKLVRKCEYPFYVDTRSDKTKILEQAEYYIHFFSNCDDYLVDDRYQVPLTILLPFVNKWTSSLEYLELILREKDWELVEHSLGCLAVLYPENQNSEEEEEEVEVNLSNQSFAYEDTLSENMENWDASYKTNEFSNGTLDEGWDWEYKENDLNNSGVPWIDTEEMNDSNVSVSISEPSLKLCCVESDDWYPSIISKSKSFCEGSDNKSRLINHVPVKEEEIVEKNYIPCDTYVLPETVLPKTVVPDSLFDNIRVDGKMKNSSNSENISNTVNRKFDDKSKDSHGIKNKMENLLISERRTSQSDLPSVLNNSVDHKRNTQSAQVDIHSLESSPSVNLCLNLQSEGQTTGILESAKKLDGPSESPIACSFSLEEGNDRHVDSGYPNSTSAHDMDLDLTPEQVDELFTENDVMTDQGPDHNLDSISVSSKDSDSISEHLLAQPPPPPPVIIPQPDLLFEEDLNVENGDVANNNRDGEGNNVLAVAPQPAEVLEENDNNAGAVGVALHENFDLIPLIAAAEDLDNDNEIELNVVEPFPPWLLNLLGLANGGGVGGRDRDVVERDSDDDTENNINQIDEGVGDDDNLDSSSASEDLEVCVAVPLESSLQI